LQSSRTRGADQGERAVPQETYVAVHVTGDIGGSSGQGPTITIPEHVHLEVYFDGNFQTKAENIVNTSGYAANLQFYGISPTDPSVQQTVNLNSGGGSTTGFSAVFYTQSANFRSMVAQILSAQLSARTSMPTATYTGITIASSIRRATRSIIA